MPTLKIRSSETRRSLEDWQTKWCVKSLQYCRVYRWGHVMGSWKSVFLPIAFQYEELAHLMVG